MTPPQPGEPSEIPVEGDELGAVLDGERGEVGIGGEIAGGPDRFEKAAKHGGVTFGWMQDPPGTR